MTCNCSHTISRRNENIVCYFLVIRNNKAITLYALVSTDYTVHTSFDYFYSLCYFWSRPSWALSRTPVPSKMGMKALSELSLAWT